MFSKIILSESLISIFEYEFVPDSAWIFWFHNDNIFVSFELGENDLPPFVLNKNIINSQPDLRDLILKNIGKSLQCLQFATFDTIPCILLFDFYHSQELEKILDSRYSNNILYKFQNLRKFTNYPNVDQILLAGTAYQLYRWNCDSKFCGRCGEYFIISTTEVAKSCSSCKNTIFPTISPAIIVAITKNNQILLAHNKNFPEGLYSLIAGFCSPGESLEQALEREIYEEIGISVQNIKYIESQPWPFPNSLMLAFSAEWKSGDILVDNKEITDARWFSIENLPKLPSTVSVARKLIDQFIQSQKLHPN